MEEVLSHYTKILHPALMQTLYMSSLATFAGFFLGLIPGIALVVTRKGGLCEKLWLFRSLDLLINMLRSFPFIILIIVLIPFTKLLVGKSIGTTAAIVPLTIGIAPFIAKLIENALLSVDEGVIEAAKSWGASKMQIIFRVMFSQALPNIIQGLCLTLIVVIGYSALAGTVGGGGLGDVATRYGYQRFRVDIMIETVIILVVLVQAIQLLGDFLYRKTKK